MSYLCSIDLGTSSVKTALFDEYGKLAGAVTKSYSVLVPQPGFAEQVPEIWWESVCTAINVLLKDCAVDKGEIIGVGLSGQMHGLVSLDRNGACIRNAIIHIDQRSDKEVKGLIEQFGWKQLETYTSNYPSTGFMLMSLLWMKEHEKKAYDRISYVLSPKDYIRYRLTGTIGTDITDAAGTYAFDVKNQIWATKLIEKCDIDSSIFPDVKAPYEAAGVVTGRAAEECGLNKGCVVGYGGADQVMQCLGNGVMRPNTMTSTIGTGGQVLCTMDRPESLCRQAINLFNNARPDSWYLLGATLSAGLSLSWYMSKIRGSDEYLNLDAYCSAPPVCAEGLFFLPYLAGIRTPHNDSNARAGFIGLALKHDKVDMTRAIMEGVVFSLKECMEPILAVVPQIDTVIASGGATKSRMWLQLQADIYNMPVQVNRGSAQAALGAAVAASVAAGIYKDLDQAAANMIHTEKEIIDPNPRNSAVFQEKYEKYKMIYPALAALQREN